MLPDLTAIRTVLSRVGVEASVEEVAVLGAVCRIDHTDNVTALTALRDCDMAFEFCVDCFGIDTGEAVDVVYHLRSLVRDEEVTVKTAVDYDGTLDSVWSVFPAVLMPEREACEMFGLRLAGHPNPKRLLTTDGVPPFLRKTTLIRDADTVRDRASQVIDPQNLERTVGTLAPDAPVFDSSVPLGDEPLPEGAWQPAVQTLPAGLRRAPSPIDEVASEHLVLNMGPQHPSTHGVLRILLELDGEEIVTGEAVVGHLHRGIEKLAESRRFGAVATLMDRGDYAAGLHNELAFALATEKIMDIEVPRRASYLRVLFGELNRIASHILWLGPQGLDAGMMGLFLYVFRDREVILDILEDVTGQRMMFNYIRPGGVLADITTTAETKIRSFLETIDTYIDEHEEILLGNEIFQARTIGIGVLDRAGAIAFGQSGANLRASGVGFDVRRERPYAAYPELEFDVPTASAGDVFARCQVRIEEMRQSVRIIRQCIDGLPEGEHTAKVARVLRPPAGESYAAVESPRGELGVHLVTDGTDTPYRMRYRPPTLYALQAGESMLPGTLLADGVVLMGSMDVVLGEIDR